MARSFTVLIFLLAAATPGAAFGQPMPAYLQWQRSDRHAAYTDTLRALIVFTRFRDDDEPGDACTSYRGWPLTEDPETLPAFANDILATAPTPPFPDSTLTDYFYRQSGGRFVLYGDAFPRTLVSEQPEAFYHNRDEDGQRQDGGYGYLTREILDRIDPEIDFTQYDANGDGFVDYLFVILRRDSRRDDRTFDYTGISCLDARCGGGLSGGRPPGAELVYDGKRLDWNFSGSIIHNRTAGNVDPQIYHTRMMAHELGHDLWAGDFNHVHAITTNDVPANGTDQIGYVLMAGAGGAADRRGDQSISAFERDLLGWIDCEDVTHAQDDLRLGDLYTTGDCVRIPLPGAGRRLYVTNRQQIGFFDRRRPMQYRAGHGCESFDDALLHTTGLLVHLADDHHLDVLPADDTLDLSPHDDAYRGDLFSPETQRQLTPWTRPNVDGFDRYPPGFSPSWHALDDVRYTGERGVMTFRYVEDFRQQPTIRAESWMGDETRGTAFETPVVVTEGATLHVQADVTFASDLRLEPLTTVVVEEGGQLTITDPLRVELFYGARLVVRGRLVLYGPPGILSAGGLRTEGDGRIEVVF